MFSALPQRGECVSRSNNYGWWNMVSSFFWSQNKPLQCGNMRNHRARWRFDFPYRQGSCSRLFFFITRDHFMSNLWNLVWWWMQTVIVIPYFICIKQFKKKYRVYWQRNPSFRTIMLALIQWQWLLACWRPKNRKFYPTQRTGLIYRHAILKFLDV